MRVLQPRFDGGRPVNHHLNVGRTAVQEARSTSENVPAVPQLVSRAVVRSMMSQIRRCWSGFSVMPTSALLRWFLRDLSSAS
jgi:hypothetical protein